MEYGTCLRGRGSVHARFGGESMEREGLEVGGLWIGRAQSVCLSLREREFFCLQGRGALAVSD